MNHPEAHRTEAHRTEAHQTESPSLVRMGEGERSMNVGYQSIKESFTRLHESFLKQSARNYLQRQELGDRIREFAYDEQGDVPGWVLVVLMTTGLVTAIWAIAAPRISSLLRNSLDSMNNVR